MTCKLDIGTAQQDTAFNVAATCAYGNSPDQIKIKSEWTKKAAAQSNSHNRVRRNKKCPDWTELLSKCQK